jgi:S-adenosylmethionine hydrolase
LAIINTPANGTCDYPVNVTIVALDQFGNVNTNENRQELLIASAPGVASGTITFVGGVATGSISSTLPQYVTVSLGFFSSGVNSSSSWIIAFSPGIASNSPFLT